MRAATMVDSDASRRDCGFIEKLVDARSEEDEEDEPQI